jgi:hypothetical protein
VREYTTTSKYKPKGKKEASKGEIVDIIKQIDDRDKLKEIKDYLVQIRDRDVERNIENI